jgi:tellurite methyltransferase
MTDHDRARWEEKHERSVGSPLGASAPAIGWLPRAGPAPGGLALDLASGRGRNCRALVDRGYRVIAADISHNALLDLRAMHGDLEDTITCVETDFDDWPFASEIFDLVVQCDFLDRRLFPSIKRSVKSGGLVLVDTFCGPVARGVSGPHRQDYRLNAGELPNTFRGWHIEHHITREATAREALLARKP